MGFALKDILKVVAVGCIGLVSAHPQSNPSVNANDYDANDIITRDVCIIGGGSSGTYTAIRLREMNKSVVVVEMQDRLGGHTQTYIDPTTGIPVDYGVVVFHNDPVVINYFAHFKIALTTANFNVPGVTTQFVDFRTGKADPAYMPTDPTEAFGIYAEQLAQYPYLANGFFLPDPVPADLLLPFGQFVAKYSIGAVVQTIFSLAQGSGEILQLPTVYIMMLISLDLLRSFETGFLTTAQHDNSAIYNAARAELGADALLSSHVVKMDRNSSPYSSVVVDTPNGRKLIRAKKIVVAIPPNINNLSPFDLDNTESSLFKQFSSVSYYTGLLRNTGIPNNITVTNVGPNTPYNLPDLPGVYSIYQTGVPGLMDVKYGSSKWMSVDKVKADIISTLLRLRNDHLPTTTPEFAAFSDHSPFQLTVPASAIAAGFYKNLYSLQGHRNTYYTGAAWAAQDSSAIWNFTEYQVLPQIIASL